ncbi:hypothetical protein Salat_2184200 [Sesamum alatum]|uniref:Uncharacterized protein n=1 Tax=Sesamum alatum TaxID=300844 RepID=A0AAE1XTL2_9LAMI|nr:hypothetical protein Salat_2184200 [Sesamum alatum]
MSKWQRRCGTEGAISGSSLLRPCAAQRQRHSRRNRNCLGAWSGSRSGLNSTTNEAALYIRSHHCFTPPAACTATSTPCFCFSCRCFTLLPIILIDSVNTNFQEKQILNDDF